MKTIASFFHDFHADDSGAAFIEYTALLGVILAVGLVTLTQVGDWASAMWTSLCSTLGTESGVACGTGGTGTGGTGTGTGTGG